jgi:hypothetical protein
MNAARRCRRKPAPLVTGPDGEVGVSADYTRLLDRRLGALMHVEFKTDRREIVEYAVVLLITVDGEMETVRLYDGAHGENELHRYTREGGKQAGEIFHRGTLAQGMRAAIEEIERGYRVMIESWHRQ